MPDKKDNWDKVHVILQPVGGLLTALAVAIVGILGSKIIEKRQIEDTNARLYTELTTRREESESKLRTDMFNSIIGTFLQDTANQSMEVRILNLELLSSNFHEAIDIGPLFRHLDQQIRGFTMKDAVKQKYLERLKEVSKDVIRKQVAVLEQYGEEIDIEIPYDDIKKDSVDDSSFELVIQEYNRQGKLPSKSKKTISLAFDTVKPQRQEISFRITVVKSDPAKDQELNETEEFSSKPFWVGFYDFPMIDNIRLSDGHRFALVLNKFDTAIAVHITMIYFPGTYASLKERPYYDEIIQDLIRTRKDLTNDPEKSNNKFILLYICIGVAVVIIIGIWSFRKRKTY